MAKDKSAKPSGKPKTSAPAKSEKGAPKAVKLAKGNGSHGADRAAKAAKEKGVKEKPAKQDATLTPAGASNGKPPPPPELTPFLVRQKERLLQLRDSMLDSMMGVAKDNLRTRAEGSEASAFGMHQADAGSDAYDRDFALSLLSQEQDALYEIEEALKRIDLGAYGVCEMSGKPISHARLEALPFARYTVECQSQIEKQGKVTRARVPVTSLFGLTDEEPSENEEEEPVSDTKE
jgi:DnaK suppressor protein